MNLIDERIHGRIIAKKLELDGYRPLSDDVVRKLREAMEIEYTYNSNAIEGNMLTKRETQLVIREGITIGGRSVRDHLEAQNHPKAIHYIEGFKDRDFAEQDILKVHGILFSGVLQNTGSYRISQVYVEGSDFLPPPAFEVQGLVEKLLDWVRRNPEELRPVEVAAVFHYRFVSIHPFDDGNGRVARLLMNLFLIKHRYPFTVIRNYDRRRYYNTLKKADDRDLKPFVDFVARCVEESIDLFLRAVKSSDESSRFLSLGEAAKLVPYSQEYLSLLARRGRLAAVKIGKNWHVTQEALDDYLAGVSPRRKKTERKSRQ